MDNCITRRPNCRRPTNDDNYNFGNFLFTSQHNLNKLKKITFNLFSFAFKLKTFKFNWIVIVFICEYFLTKMSRILILYQISITICFVLNLKH